MKILRLGLALSAPLALASFAFSQGDPQVVARIIDEGKNHSRIMDTLHELAVDIGSRLTSSTHLDHAEQWAMGKFRGWGCKNVHLEKWGEFPVGFDRGRNGYGRMVSPFKSDFEYTTPSWTEGTNGPLRGTAVLMPKDMDGVNAVKAKLKGAWVIVPTGFPRTRRTDTTPADPVADAIQNAGIAGTVYGSRNELCVTFGNYRDKTYDKHPMDRQVIVRKSDMERILRNLDFGRDVQLEFNLDQKFVKGPRPLYNVVAEIPGTEKPDEVVIVSGHLDSWDGPGSQGAQDNGVGTNTAMEAARILCKVGAKPKRTIRFILWTGEEQGIFGSAAYVKDHASELAKISCNLVDDGGTNYQGGYVGLESQRSMFETAFAPMNAAFPEMPEKFVVQPKMPRGGGSDHASFNAVGVPGFFTIETGRDNYTYVHHTQHDRFETCIKEYLVQSGTNHAVVAYNLASADTLVPRG